MKKSIRKIPNINHSSHSNRSSEEDITVPTKVGLRLQNSKMNNDFHLQKSNKMGLDLKMSNPTSEKLEKNSLKRTGTIEDDDPSSTEDGEGDQNTDFGKKMSKMLEMFSSEVTKNLHSKKKRMEHFLSGTIKANQSKVAEMWSVQSENQKLLVKEMQENVVSALDQWKTDNSRMKEQEEKTMKNYNQLIKSNQQIRTIMLERFNAVRQAQDRFFKTLEEQEAKNKEACDNMQNDMKKELCALQKKMIKEGEKEEAENMKKSLQTMLLK